MEDMKALEIAKAMLNKVHLIKIYENDDDFKSNKRYNPFYSELKGMEMMLKMMEVEFEYEYDDDIKVVAVTVAGMRAAD